MLDIFIVCLPAVPMPSLPTRKGEGGGKEIVVLCQEACTICTAAPHIDCCCRVELGHGEGFHGTRKAAVFSHVSCINRSYLSTQTSGIGFK